jgi:hypothetical protein
VVHRLTFVALFMLAITCVAQQQPTIESTQAARDIGTVLYRAHTSGSLAYWGDCRSNGAIFDFPRLRFPSHKDAPPIQLLREMFVDYPKMRVTQERNGNIRMIQSDIPQDLLDFRLSHVSFGSRNNPLTSPIMVLWMLLASPDVKAFMMTQPPKTGPSRI